MIKNYINSTLIRNPLKFSIVLSILISTIGNYTFWQSIWVSPELNWLIQLKLTVGVWIALISLLILLQGLFLGRYTTKIIAIILLLLTVPAQYFMVSYGVVIDPSMLRNALQTDSREIQGLINITLCIVAVCAILLPLIWIGLHSFKTDSIRYTLKRNLAVVVIALITCLLALFMIQSDIITLMRNHKSLRYQITPFNVMYGIGRVIAGERVKLPFKSLGLAQAIDIKPALPVLVLVLGETARSDHFSINGYTRLNQAGVNTSTTPHLDYLKQNSDQLISFTQVTSCGTNTADSVPCMFSHLDRKDFFYRTANYENILDILQKTGYKILWLDNNSGCKGVCDRVSHEDLTHNTHPMYCHNTGCVDQILIHDLSDRIKTLAKTNNKIIEDNQKNNSMTLKGIVIVLHQMGSHGPAYYQRSPELFKRFKPECTNTALQQCDISNVINAYDNSIVYTDYLLSDIIKQLNNLGSVFAPGLIYISDHGESLGENGNYLHGLPYQLAPKAQIHVPLIVWLSSNLSKQRGIDRQCLEQYIHKPLSHHHLFYSLLGLLNIQTHLYQPNLDWFKPCTAVN